MKHSHVQLAPRRATGRPGSASRIAIQVLSIVIGMLAATACHAADASKSSVEKARTLPQLIGGVVSRSTQLTYITEQDSDVFVFYRNTPVEELTDNVFLSLLRRPAGSLIQQQPWSTFFNLRTSSDPTGRWATLRQYLEANLTNLTVFRISREAPYEAQYDLFAVGIFNGNIVVGVQMFGIAT